MFVNQGRRTLTLRNGSGQLFIREDLIALVKALDQKKKTNYSLSIHKDIVVVPNFSLSPEILNVLGQEQLTQQQFYDHLGTLDKEKKRAPWKKYQDIFSSFALIEDRILLVQTLDKRKAQKEKEEELQLQDNLSADSRAEEDKEKE